MSRSDADAVRNVAARFLAAFLARDLDALLALADPSIEVRPLRITDQPAYRGHSGVAAWLEAVANLPDAQRALARSILSLHPHVSLIAGEPLIYELHVLAAFSLYALWPFSRLVHAWSVPLGYLTRAPIVYRSRRPIAQSSRTREASDAVA
jgi:Nitrate reductase gamma subunit